MSVAKIDLLHSQYLSTQADISLCHGILVIKIFWCI